MVAILLVLLSETQLTHPADRQAFRLWFTFLAESQYHLRPDQRARDVIDCAALLRFAYRKPSPARRGLV